MKQTIAIHWFRQDLRLSDNPALVHAAKSDKVLPIYILDDINPGKYKMGAASRWWLHHSLESLNISLDKKLNIYTGDPLTIIKKLIKKYSINIITWNRCYEPWQIKRDKKIKQELVETGVEVYSDNGSLLWEPWEALKQDGTPYKVFTPFYNKGCLGAIPSRKPISKPRALSIKKDSNYSNNLKNLKLLPKIKWAETISNTWQVGEVAAQKQLKKFLKSNIDNYKNGRDFPAINATSRLSPYLHFGEISPNQIWHAAKLGKNSADLKCFLSELGWREFSYNLLFYNPSLPSKNLQSKFDKFKWRNNKRQLAAWQRGRTGIPIVDAGMRELWQTGYMHNRVRMVVASFLVKNLLIDWRYGERWFWDCLLDADLANNSASWQWVSGSGADAAPYFRVFNPVLQGEKFDPDGEYTKHYVPELKNLPKKYLFKPWEASTSVLDDAGIVLGKTYPRPIVDLKESREQALAAYDAIR